MQPLRRRASRRRRDLIGARLFDGGLAVVDRSLEPRSGDVVVADEGRSFEVWGWRAGRATVFYHTSEHDQERPSQSVCTSVSLPEASSDTLLLARAATWAVRRTWRDGHRYSKAELVTMDFVRPAGA